MITLKAVNFKTCNYDYIDNCLVITFTLLDNPQIYQAVSKCSLNENETFDSDCKFKINSFILDSTNTKNYKTLKSNNSLYDSSKIFDVDLYKEAIKLIIDFIQEEV